MVGLGGCAVPSRSEVSVGYRQGQPDGVWAEETAAEISSADSSSMAFD